MKLPYTCPNCDNEFEYEEYGEEEGDCPHCNAHYDIEFDCIYEGAVLIPVFHNLKNDKNDN